MTARWHIDPDSARWSLRGGTRSRAHVLTLSGAPVHGWCGPSDDGEWRWELRTGLPGTRAATCVRSGHARTRDKARAVCDAALTAAAVAQREAA